MKPSKKPVKSTSGVQSPATVHKLFTNILKKGKPGSAKLLSTKDQPEIFIILTEDIPAQKRSALLQLKKGITVNPEDNLFQRLLELEKENHHLKSLSQTDELTGFYNKRFLNRQLKIEVTRTKRTGQPFCLMFIDLDNFKSINDTLGHAKGDEFLVTVSSLIGEKIRPTDFACRYGGDEFVVIMPATFLLDGITIAQRWHDLILQVAAQMKVNVSSSIGVDEYNVSSMLSAEEFLDKVDKELYHVKKTGKNRVSYPGLLQTGKAQARSVTPAEKDALYKTSVPLTQKEKPLSSKR